MQYRNTIKPDTFDTISRIILDSTQDSENFLSDAYEENIILQLCVCWPYKEPAELAALYFSGAGSKDRKAERIAQVYREHALDRSDDRIAMVYQCSDLARRINVAISCNRPLAEARGRLSAGDAEPMLRLVLISLVSMWRPFLSEVAFSRLMHADRKDAGRCLEAILELAGAPARANESGEDGSGYAMNARSAAEADEEPLDGAEEFPLARRTSLDAVALESEVCRLAESLDRSNRLIASLQDDFEEESERIRNEERTNVISLLNSEKYGHILDTLQVAREVLQDLPSETRRLPGMGKVRNLVRNMARFVEESGICPIEEVGARFLARPLDLDNYEYDGSPFASSREEKLVEVVSPGWQLSDSDLIIGFPRVREIQPNEEE